MLKSFWPVFLLVEETEFEILISSILSKAVEIHLKYYYVGEKQNKLLSSSKKDPDLFI